MTIRTGQTIYETIVSVDLNNNPISAVTLNNILYKDGIAYDILSAILADDVNAIFTVSWSASSVGNYQLFSKNETTNLIYVSDVYLVIPDDEALATVYVGF
jgi:hypothetical protein